LDSVLDESDENSDVLLSFQSNKDFEAKQEALEQLKTILQTNSSTLIYDTLPVEPMDVSLI